ncbi:hypothetical protein D8674_032729 [Pyrus ussuriensis x Pyrus communis]|uniref:Uncharacterized protein n=1 Tax=Pyrus ussuriensis x Pyrus communis TaxID=2448454 RepID=A0A5N5HX15_9ROSA|nr:hypothetical protein D8674_032729 [Pyrus ussuriensis x Pyrus communis]
MMGLERVFLTLIEELEESERFWKGKSRKSEEGNLEGAWCVLQLVQKYGGT